MKRIKKSPMTTAIATLLTLGCLFFVYTGKATLTETSGFLVIAGGLLFSDDKKFIENFGNKSKDSSDGSA